MTPQDAIDLGRQALMTTMFLAAPMLLVGAAVGLLVGLLQALTQIQDQTISFVPKIIAMTATIGFCLPWMVQRLVEYSEDLITNIPKLVMGG